MPAATLRQNAFNQIVQMDLKSVSLLRVPLRLPGDEIGRVQHHHLSLLVGQRGHKVPVVGIRFEVGPYGAQARGRAGVVGM